MYCVFQAGSTAEPLGCICANSLHPAQISCNGLQFVFLFCRMVSSTSSKIFIEVYRMPNQVNLEQNLHILRANQDMTQEQLAAKLNVTRQSISKWEKGQVRPDLETILMLAEIFQVSVEELICGKIESIFKTPDPQKLRSIVAEKQANKKHEGDTPCQTLLQIQKGRILQ